MSANDARKVDNLCARVLGDIGSIHARTSPLDLESDPTTPSVLPMPTELVALRRYVREVQDTVRDMYPMVFFK